MKVLLSLVFCILLLSHCAFGDFSYDSVVSISGKDDVVRAYSHIALPGGFIYVGASVQGSISNNNGNFEVDTSVFRLSTGLNSFPILNWNYYHGNAQINPTSFGVNGSALSSAYIPTYVAEYVEKNGVDGLQIGEDEIVGHINLAQLSYDVDVDSEAIGSGDDKFNVYHITVTSKNGVFQMNFTLADRAVSVDGNRISAEQTKIDIGIYNYYDSSINKPTKLTCLFSDLCDTTGPSDKNSSLALLSFFAAANLDLDISGNGQISVQGDTNGMYAGFSYASNAKVSKDSDGAVTVNANVYTNVTGNGSDYGEVQIKTLFTASASHKFVVQSFEGIRPNTIEYDPTFGGASESFNNSGIKVASSFVLVAFALLALLL